MSEEYSNKIPITLWAEADRPREKLLSKGRSVLSDAELIAILIGSGNRELSAVELAKVILGKTKNNLNDLGKLSVSELIKIKGIGEAKAISIIAALELGRRRKEEEVVKKVRVSASIHVYNYMKPYLADLHYEEFWVLLLTRSNDIMKAERVSHGGVSGTVADPKIIFNKALEALASSVILCHNHPSGNLNPSDADVKLTKKLKEAGVFLEIPVLDHVIYTDNGYYSFADEGML
ncbi:MAG: DNA repair protein RadC [Bacteroidetes bacterium]|nr:DNA repair protein RadC [Bacteroidota bacterium]